MGHSSTGFRCHHCDSEAPVMGAGARFLYLTSPDRESAKLVESCRDHAVYETRPNGSLVPLQRSVKAV